MTAKRRKTLSSERPAKPAELADQTSREDPAALQYFSYYVEPAAGDCANSAVSEEDKLSSCLAALDRTVEHTEYILADSGLILHLSELVVIHGLLVYYPFEKYVVIVVTGSLEYIDVVKRQLLKIARLVATAPSRPSTYPAADNN